MNLFIRLFIIQIFLVQYFSQSNLDSLNSILNDTKNDSNKVKILSEIIIEYTNLGKIIESEQLINELLKTSKEISYSKGIALGHRHRGSLLLNLGKFQEALKEYELAKNIFVHLKDNVGIAGTLVNIGLVHYREGSFNLALNYMLEVKKINDLKIKLDFIGALFNNLGVIYQELNNLDKALEYFNLAIEHYKNKEIVTANIYVNIGTIYRLKKNYSRAFDFFEKSKIISQKYNNERILSSCLYGIGIVYFEQNQFDLAINYLKESLAIREGKKDKVGMVESLNYLGKVYSKQNNILMAEENVKEAIKIAEEIKFPYELINSYRIYARIDSLKGKYQSSLNWFIKHKDLSDSLFNDRVTKDIYKSEIKYEYEKKEEVLLREKLEANEKLASQQKYIFFVVFILIIVFVILFWNYKQKRIKDKLNLLLEDKINERTKELVLALEKAEKTEKMKTEFLAQMSHEIRTPLTNIINLAGLLISDFKVMDEDELKSVFNGVSNSGKRIIRTIELILNYSQLITKNYNLTPDKLDLDIIIKNILAETKELNNNKNITIEYENKLLDSVINADEYSVWFIFKNIIENSIIYTNSGKVELKLYNLNEKIIFESKDTGVGIAKEYLDKIFEPFIQEETGYTRSFDGVGLGLPLSKKYADLNGYEINIESQKGEGTIVKVTLIKNN